MTSADCPRCAALTRGRAFVAQVRENGGNGWEPTAELVEALCDDLVQARQALQRLSEAATTVWHQASVGSGYVTYDALEEIFEANSVAREALVERGTEQDSGGARGARAEEGRLQFNPGPLSVVERRDNVTAVEWIKGRSREDRLRVWLALGGTEEDFPVPAPVSLSVREGQGDD